MSLNYNSCRTSYWGKRAICNICKQSADFPAVLSEFCQQMGFSSMWLPWRRDKGHTHGGGSAVWWLTNISHLTHYALTGMGAPIVRSWPSWSKLFSFNFKPAQEGGTIVLSVPSLCNACWVKNHQVTHGENRMQGKIKRLLGVIKLESTNLRRRHKYCIN